MFDDGCRNRISVVPIGRNPAKYVCYSALITVPYPTYAIFVAFSVETGENSWKVFTRIGVNMIGRPYGIGS